MKLFYLLENGDQILTFRIMFTMTKMVKQQETIHSKEIAQLRDLSFILMIQESTITRLSQSHILNQMLNTLTSNQLNQEESLANNQLTHHKKLFTSNQLTLHSKLFTSNHLTLHNKSFRCHKHQALTPTFTLMLKMYLLSILNRPKDSRNST